MPSFFQFVVISVMPSTMAGPMTVAFHVGIGPI
jgi:hypothetical protein